MNKAEKEYCNRCYLHERCGFVNRGMEDGCTELDAFSLGYEKAIENAAEWLDKNSPNYVYWMDEEFGKEDLVEDFKKEMEK